MKKINLAVTGCMGRMGKQIIRSAKSDKNFKLVTLTEDRSVKAKINGKKVIDVSIDDWKEPNKNPDGSKNKFKIVIFTI